MDVGKLQRLYEVGGENPITGEKEVQRCVWEEAARRHRWHIPFPLVYPSVLAHACFASKVTMDTKLH